MNKQEKQEQLLDLLTAEALHGLTAGERAELDRLTREFPELNDDSLALTAAAVEMARLDIDEQLPSNISEAVEKEFDRLFAAPIKDSAGNVAAPAPSGSGLFGKVWLGWALAGAASVALALNVFVSEQKQIPTAAVTTVETKPSLTEERSKFIAATADVTTVDWAVDEKKPEGVTGDVVWSQSQQKGYMRFRGLAVNDKSKETYQLWIFDENQPQTTPVDGGVFDIDANGEIVVPIDAKIRVGKAIAFAVTVEKPGGVVVSKREKIAAIAKVGA